LVLTGGLQKIVRHSQHILAREPDDRDDDSQIPNSEQPLSAHAIELPLTIPFQTSPGTHGVKLHIEATFTDAVRITPGCV
jgi:hypothetical protein